MKFYSKAETLKKLQITNGSIPKLLIFNFNNFYSNQKINLNKIKKNFNGGLIAIRSSFQNEDTILSSQAGKYQSFLNINSSDSKRIIICIDKIKRSKKDTISNDDCFFVQEMVKNVKLSGVVLTKNILTLYFSGIT